MDTSEPVFDVLEGLLVSDVVGKDDSMSTFVVGGGDGLEALLASGVPDLHFDGLALHVEGPDLEVDANGGEE